MGIGLIPRGTLDAVQHQLVAQKIQINPVIRFSASGALKQLLIKGKRFIKISHWNRQVERAQVSHERTLDHNLYPAAAQ